MKLTLLLVSLSLVVLQARSSLGRGLVGAIFNSKPSLDQTVCQLCEVFDHRNGRCMRTRGCTRPTIATTTTSTRATTSTSTTTLRTLLRPPSTTEDHSTFEPSSPTVHPYINVIPHQTFYGKVTYHKRRPSHRHQGSHNDLDSGHLPTPRRRSQYPRLGNGSVT